MTFLSQSVTRAAAVIASASLMAGLVVLGSKPAAATTRYGTAMVTTQRMASATLNTHQHGTYPHGMRIALSCYVRGQAVRGVYSGSFPNGLDNLWYKASDGYYAADVDLNTGSNNPVTGECRKWGHARSYNAGVAGQCTDGAYRKFKAYSGAYPALTGNAKDWYASAQATGWSTAKDAEINSIVVFQAGVHGASSLGHVGWVDQLSLHSDGLYVHVVEMNAAGGPGVYSTRWVKDVVGMSYILAPHH